MPASPISVKRIDHVTLVVKDLDVSRSFYVDLLGMEEVSRPGFRFPGLWFQAGTTQIHLIEEHAESGPSQTSVPENCTISRTHHFAFEVDNAHESAEVLRSRDITIQAGPKSRPDGPTQLYIFDPDSNLVELFSYS
ncbi:VOC family protein [Thalassoglobus sp. JC818]|uniref:VOC family protein n=1 Tax=Thalassoglobus sp. JC818 TaxID=3232136 RepID=UPI00345B4C1F